MDEDEKELLVVDDVPETSEEGLSEIDTDTSEVIEETQEESTQDVQNSEEDIESQIEERANRLVEERIETRLIRDRKKQEEKHNQEMEKYRYLESIVNNGLGTSNIDEAISRASEYYKEQGINIPAYEQKSYLTEREERILAKAEAEEIKQCGEREMEYEAERIAKIPFEKRTLKEKVILNELAGELIEQRNVRELQEKGYDTKVLKSEGFTKFKSKFAPTESIVDIYDMYQKINSVQPKETPRSPGSAKTTVQNNNVVKEFYTQDEVRRLTEEDLDNPELMKAVEYSMTKWDKDSK